MRFLILSDIHGSKLILEEILRFYDAGHYDMLLLLGDLLNYGPRNGLPEGLDAPGVADLLSRYAKDIVAVRGNCDSEVDQMLLPFPMMGDYAIVTDGSHRLFLTHGHIYNADNLPQAPTFDVFFQGHTHVQMLRRDDENAPVICNTGSPTFPKCDQPPTFATLEDGLLQIRTLDGGVLQEMRVW